MSKADLIKEQLQITRMVVNGTMADVSNEQAAAAPGGKAHPIGANLAHLIMSEDFIVNGTLKGGQPVMMSTHAGKTGVSEPQPAPGGDRDAWAQRVKVDVPALREYAKAVHEATDAYVSGLGDADLERTIEFGPMGQQPVSNVLTLITIVHASNHIGEVSALKGLAGAKGYPF